ncbi:hypothetical protein A2755_00690 [Candidatus Wolfebacteria bacterium RIFCSPHIGHO2_01_FULL_48_22]|uniref:Secretion system C-terminal sorting domain-containing protein n=2 Tax=Candidatus Wolfeibacteriota TaxID=1752735 RepID=A0A1F8DTA7_9BACT|nr:MAG: hypothetical protein A2755_00690 [Candidatus Wolfebacteria bacterium RIFCSPHIGHO2_01_FULL_48_22]OGM93532.1 MAG: hypothetical protein A2935_02800 [Candidatus Wolfebacteria bacterium RIFCSPLOWO2_01_FULL_47_17b]
MKLLSFLFVFLIPVQVFGQWNSQPGQYGTNVSVNHSITSDYATHGSSAGLFSLSGSSEWNGLANYFTGGKYWRGSSHSTPMAVLLDGRLTSLTGADSLSISVGIIIQTSLGKLAKIAFDEIRIFASEKRLAGERNFVLKIGDLVYVSVTRRAINEWETIVIDIPEEHQKGTIANIDVDVLAISSTQAVATSSFILDNIRYQYDYNGTITIVDSFGDSITGVDDPTATPEKFALHQNYPNPFNPNTYIVYRIPYTGRIKITVYNVLGNEIVTLVNEEKPAGEYDIQFDASSLSSGTYFYTLETNEGKITKKMVLLK